MLGAASRPMRVRIRVESLKIVGRSLAWVNGTYNRADGRMMAFLFKGAEHLAALRDDALASTQAELTIEATVTPGVDENTLVAIEYHGRISDATHDLEQEGTRLLSSLESAAARCTGVCEGSNGAKINPRASVTTSSRHGWSTRLAPSAYERVRAWWTWQVALDTSQRHYVAGRMHWSPSSTHWRTLKTRMGRAGTMDRLSRRPRSSCASVLMRTLWNVMQLRRHLFIALLSAMRHAPRPSDRGVHRRSPGPWQAVRGRALLHIQHALPEPSTPEW